MHTVTLQTVGAELINKLFSFTLFCFLYRADGGSKKGMLNVKEC